MSLGGEQGALGAVSTSGCYPVRAGLDRENMGKPDCLDPIYLQKIGYSQVNPPKGTKRQQMLYSFWATPMAPSSHNHRRVKTPVADIYLDLRNVTN